MPRIRKAVENNHGLCPKRPANTSGPHLFQHPTNLSPTWCFMCGRAPAVFCVAHVGRHAWAAGCMKAIDADTDKKPRSGTPPPSTDGETAP
jgi:hypothetical protein